MRELVLAMCGLGFGLGATLAIVGLLPGDPPRVLAPTRRLRIGGAWWQWLSAGLAGSVAWLVTGWPVAGFAVAAVVRFGPWLFSAGKAAARQIERLEALEDWLRRLADTMGTGTLGMLSALRSSARDTPAAIASEVVTLAQRLRTWDFELALLAFADEIDDQIGDAAAAGLCVAHQQGAGTAELLRSLARQVADDVTARRNAEAERARRRSTARILLLIWALMFFGFASFSSSSYTAVYSTVPGQLVLAATLGIVGIAVVWLRRLGTEPRSPRFLTSADGAKS